ncbi:MAG: Crossover junction endodeoxyribonuclease RuvC [Lentisphaerae bacterium ADurb.BinA184]|nr:MAG: Crossover junction endodeoxyribonuclease RuvC [Lentisphaerae bacterium ADurb.BinA184]
MHAADAHRPLARRAVRLYGLRMHTAPPPPAPWVRILGVDPALRCTGYAILDTDGHTMRLADCGVIRTPAKAALSECLRRLSGGMRQMVESFAPTMVAIEGGFYSKNARTAMVLGAARGTLIAVAAERQLPVYEYAPRRIKQAVCGWGQAGKEQVAAVVATLVGLDRAGVLSDATDAAATAICHANAWFTNQGLYLPKPV